MNAFIKIFIIYLFFLFAFKSFSKENISSLKTNRFTLNFDFGVKISGIKKEDFLKSNTSPLFRFTLTKNQNKNFDFGIGYQGNYFYYIEDSVKHFYDFLFLINSYKINNLSFVENLHSLKINFGCGYFYNYFYKSSNICMMLALVNQIHLNKLISLELDLSSIIGWDIYQGNEDILPSISFGFIYRL